MKWILFAVLLVLSFKAGACDYETVVASEGYYAQRFVPVVYGYSYGRPYVIGGGYYQSYWIAPRYAYRPVYRPVYAPVYSGPYVGGSPYYLTPGYRRW